MYQVRIAVLSFLFVITTVASGMAGDGDVVGARMHLAGTVFRTSGLDAAILLSGRPDDTEIDIKPLVSMVVGGTVAGTGPFPPLVSCVGDRGERFPCLVYRGDEAGGVYSYLAGKGVSGVDMPDGETVRMAVPGRSQRSASGTLFPAVRDGVAAGGRALAVEMAYVGLLLAKAVPDPAVLFAGTPVGSSRPGTAVVSLFGVSGRRGLAERVRVSLSPGMAPEVVVHGLTESLAGEVAASLRDGALSALHTVPVAKAGTRRSDDGTFSAFLPLSGPVDLVVVDGVYRMPVTPDLAAMPDGVEDLSDPSMALKLRGPVGKSLVGKYVHGPEGDTGEGI